MGVNVFYGWIIVGAGIVVTCMRLGAMVSLSGKNRKLEPVASVRDWV